MSEQDQPMAPDPVGRTETPWTEADMPCVFCGRLLPRDSSRCPHCKTSYSPAVRRASREIEGPWFYLEPRNPSNRGVDFRTMLKLIEKGRLRRDSIVRGPTTKQDWVYAAEAPMLSKHLGVCPHCFATAGANDEYCPTCHRTLDERPGRLRPGVGEPGAPAWFPERETLEVDLADALKTHDMARAAQETAADETAWLEEPTPGAGVSAPTPSMAPAARRLRRPGAPAGRHPKAHIVALLTVVTVIPLGLLMMAIPIEGLFGDSSREDTIAYNIHRNRMGFWRAVGIGREEPAAPRPPSQPAQVQEDTAAIIADGLRQANQAIAEGNLADAVMIYREIERRFPADQLPPNIRSTIANLEGRIAQAREQEQAVAKVQEIIETHKEGRDQRAKVLLGELTIRERQLATAAGQDLGKLEVEVLAAIQAKEEDMQRQQRRREVQQWLNQARSDVRAKRYDQAAAALRMVRDKYPVEDLPEGTDLAMLIRTAENHGVDPGTDTAPVKPPEPAAETDQAKADRLWKQVADLEARKEYKQAIAVCEEIRKLPVGVVPQGLDAKVEELKKLQERKEKLEFFLEGGG